MARKVLIAPSLLAADFTQLAVEIQRVQDAGLSYLHFDVMDGHFVPNISFGIPVLKAVKSLQTGLILDVHLMITHPERYAEAFIQAGADIITFHVETIPHLEGFLALVALIRKHGAQVGLSLRPATPISALEPYLADLDLVLVMSVEPGFGGQSFLPATLMKIEELVKIRTAQHLNFLIEVDGGINELTGAKAIEAGADLLVAGSYLFGQQDFNKRVEKLKR
ncbi:MAG: ribulose-phosphate 3-epimerase [Bacilli bacterium]